MRRQHDGTEFVHPSPSADLARDLREHIHEILGGLARPQTIAFVEQFSADIPRDELRDALRTLCATATDDPIYISVAQLRATAAVDGGN